MIPLPAKQISLDSPFKSCSTRTYRLDFRGGRGLSGVCGLCFGGKKEKKNHNLKSWRSKPFRIDLIINLKTCRICKMPPQAIYVGLDGTLQRSLEQAYLGECILLPVRGKRTDMSQRWMAPLCLRPNEPDCPACYRLELKSRHILFRLFPT